MLLSIIIVVIVRLYEIRASAQIPLEATQKADDLSIGLRNMTIMHRKYCNTTATTITAGVTAESSVTPTVIVALSAHHALSPAVIVNNLFRRKKKGHERPRLMIISASKAEKKKKMAQICCL